MSVKKSVSKSSFSKNVVKMLHEIYILELKLIHNYINWSHRETDASKYQAKLLTISSNKSQSKVTFITLQEYFREQTILEDLMVRKSKV